MVRLTSIMISAALLGLLSLGGSGAASAETGGMTVGNATQASAQSIDQAASPATPTAAAPAALRGPEH